MHSGLQSLHYNRSPVKQSVKSPCYWHQDVINHFLLSVTAPIGWSMNLFSDLQSVNVYLCVITSIHLRQSDSTLVHRRHSSVKEETLRSHFIQNRTVWHRSSIWQTWLFLGRIVHHQSSGIHIEVKTLLSCLFWSIAVVYHCSSVSQRSAVACIIVPS